MLQTNVALNALRTPTIIPQYMTKFAMEKVCDLPGVNVSITVWQVRCDGFVVFSARQVCIISLRSPGVTKDLEIKQLSLRKVRCFAMDQVRDQPGLNVSKMVCQLRCDKFGLISARQLCIMKLEMKPAKPPQGKARVGFEATAEEWRF